MDNVGGTIKWLAMAMVVVSSVACGGGSGGSSPTAPTAPPANIAGSYNATITAASTCSANLPSDTRALEFFATVTQTGASVQVQLVAHVPGAANHQLQMVKLCEQQFAQGVALLPCVGI